MNPLLQRQTDLPTVVWVFVPTTPSVSEQLTCFGDFEQSRDELARAFATLALEWHWQPVTMDTIASTVAQVKACTTTLSPIVLNLCDGDEQQGVPGVSVIDALERADLPYTGADRAFFDITTSKIVMKQAMEAKSVPVPAWSVIYADHSNWEAPFLHTSRPLIVKPAVSAGSLGIGIDSVVSSAKALQAKVEALSHGVHGWDLTSSGLLAEEFIAGREYTTFIVGDTDRPDRRCIYAPIERVFHTALPPNQQFLSFDRLWEFYEQESPLPDGEYLWEYAPVSSTRRSAIEAVSWQAYAAVGGIGYGRVDLREDAETGDLYVLEVNAQCGLSEDENYTSIGAILRYAGVSYHDLVQQLLDNALQRFAARTMQTPPTASATMTPSLRQFATETAS